MLELKHITFLRSRHFRWRLHLCGPSIISPHIECYLDGVLMGNWHVLYAWN